MALPLNCATDSGLGRSILAVPVLVVINPREITGMMHDEPHNERPGTDRLVTAWQQFDVGFRPTSYYINSYVKQSCEAPRQLTYQGPPLWGIRTAQAMALA